MSRDPGDDSEARAQDTALGLHPAKQASPPPHSPGQRVRLTTSTGTCIQTPLTGTSSELDTARHHYSHMPVTTEERKPREAKGLAQQHRATKCSPGALKPRLITKTMDSLSVTPLNDEHDPGAPRHTPGTAHATQALLLLQPCGSQCRHTSHTAFSLCLHSQMHMDHQSSQKV